MLSIQNAAKMLLGKCIFGEIERHIFKWLVVC